MSKKGVTEYSQATNIFYFVESKVNSDNDAEAMVSRNYI